MDIDKALSVKVMELEKELELHKEALFFVERWAVHHGTKPHATPKEVLSMIQRHPFIRSITKDYVDGKVSDSFDPYLRIKELEHQITLGFPQPAILPVNLKAPSFRAG